MDPTPIYTEALREAKRRTRRWSPERRRIDEMDLALRSTEDDER